MGEQRVTLEIRGDGDTVHADSAGLQGWARRYRLGWWVNVEQHCVLSPADLAASAWLAALLLRLPHELGDALRGVSATFAIRVEPRDDEPGYCWVTVDGQRVSESADLLHEAVLHFLRVYLAAAPEATG